MKRNFCVQCFRYTAEGSELWKQVYFVTLRDAIHFMTFSAKHYDSIQLYKVK